MNHTATEREERRLVDDLEKYSNGFRLVDQEYSLYCRRIHKSPHAFPVNIPAKRTASSSMSRRLVVGLNFPAAERLHLLKRDYDPDKKLQMCWERRSELLESSTNPYKKRIPPNPYEYDHTPTTQEKRQVPLRQRFLELGIELDVPRYKNRTRSMKRRPAMSTIRHPSFDSTHCTTTTQGLKPMRSGQNLVLRSDETSSKMVHDSKSTTMPIMQQVNLLAEDNECTVQVGRSTRKRRSSRILNLSLFKSTPALKSDEESSHSMEFVTQRVRRRSSLLTKQVISMFKNEKFEKIGDSSQYKCNFLLETLEKNKNQNILNAIIGVN